MRSIFESRLDFHNEYSVCSYGDISSATMFQDMNKIVVGNVLMFVYMVLVLSKFGWIELRVRIF